MATAVSFPGVYIEEVPSSVRTIAGVATSVTAFVGFTARGPTNEAVQIFSFADFERRFGGLDVDSDLSYAVSQFFLNGGSQAWIVRVADQAAAAAINLRNDLGRRRGRADRHRTLGRAVGQRPASWRRLRQRQSGQPVQPHRLRSAGAEWTAAGHALRDLSQPLHGQRLAGLCRGRGQRRLEPRPARAPERPALRSGGDRGQRRSSPSPTSTGWATTHGGWPSPWTAAAAASSISCRAAATPWPAAPSRRSMADLALRIQNGVRAHRSGRSRLCQFHVRGHCERRAGRAGGDLGHPGGRRGRLGGRLLHGRPAQRRGHPAPGRGQWRARDVRLGRRAAGADRHGLGPAGPAARFRDPGQPRLDRRRPDRPGRNGAVPPGYRALAQRPRAAGRPRPPADPAAGRFRGLGAGGVRRRAGDDLATSASSSTAGGDNPALRIRFNAGPTAGAINLIYRRPDERRRLPARRRAGAGGAERSGARARTARRRRSSSCRARAPTRPASSRWRTSTSSTS